MPPRLLTPTMVLLLESKLGWTGLTRQPLTVHEVPPDEWAIQHQQWDAREQAARELFQVDEPDRNQLVAILALEKICLQILCSRQDRAMVERLMPFLNQTRVADAIRYAELYLHFLAAIRPAVTA